jgi:hypothetical protein
MNLDDFLEAFRLLHRKYCGHCQTYGHCGFCFLTGKRRKPHSRACEDFREARR